MLQKLNHQPNPSNINNWTISRRVIAGFAAMLLLIIALGVFALWRLMGIAQTFADLADNSLPSMLLLSEASEISRDNLISLLQIDEAGQLSETPNSSRKSPPTRHAVDELLKNYEPLISDDEERRLIEEAKRTSDIG